MSGKYCAGNFAGCVNNKPLPELFHAFQLLTAIGPAKHFIMVLATDLDGTFLGGVNVQKQQLYDLIKDNTGTQLIFVTGRGLESVIPVLNDPLIPLPDYIICDVGATIVNGHTLEPVKSLQSEIEQRWPGRSRIREQLKDIEGLSYQDVPQQRRCSFFTQSELTIDKVRAAVNKMDCEVIYSANRFLDVLPWGVNKGTSLSKLIEFLDIDAGEILVAGDTLNDLAMYQCGYKGVVVGNSEDKLVDATAGLEDVYYAEAPGAGGIMEAMTHFEFLKPA
jgi:HAD superfamily hydrolase (TIGR01484 family)